MRWTIATRNNSIELNIDPYSYPLFPIAPLILVTAPFLSTATQQLLYLPLAIATSPSCLYLYYKHGQTFYH